MGGPRQTVLRPRHWSAALLGSALLVAAPAVLAQDATWLTNPASNDFSTPTNWTPGAVPTGLANFGGSSVTTLGFSGSHNIDGFTFSTGAPAYTFDLSSGFTLHFHTGGIVNHSANAPTFNVSNSPLIFDDSSTAGNAIINLNAGTVQFLLKSTAGTAQLNAAAGTTFDFTGTTGQLGNNVITAGSIAGAGNFSLGANQLFVGANNLSTTVSGTISGNALAKVGTGTLTFSGANSYSGGTTISDGVLVAAHKTAGTIDALGSGPVTLDGGTLRVSVTGDLQNSITFNDAKTSILSAASGKNVTLTNASTVTLGLNTVAQFGSLTDTGTVTFGAGATVDPTAAVVVAGGTLKDLNNSLVGLTFAAASTTVNAGATLDFNNSFNQAIHNLMGAGTVDTGNANNLHLSLIVDPLAPASEFSGTIKGKGDVSIVGGGTMILSGVNTYKGGTFICDCSTLQLGTSASTGSIINDVANDGIFNIVNANTLGITKITNDGSANSSPGDAFGTTNFRNATTASAIEIVNKNSGATNFFDTSSAASAVILNNGGATGFFDLSTAGTATITNKNGGTTVFGNPGGNDTAGAGSANITNQQTGGATIFQAQTTAGFATIDNNGGTTSFFDLSYAGSANITNRNGGLTIFDNAASAASATIVNRQGNGFTPGLIFAGTSDAGTANITNKTFSFTVFSENSSAASATILNQNNGLTIFGTVGDAPTAGNASITNDNGGTTQFAALSTAGSATILTRNGGATVFFDNSTGGDARFITRAGGIVDFSQTTGLAGDGKITAGSLAGGGDYYLGGNQLTVGSNDLSTRVSGTINDGVSPLACGCVIPGSGASLVKVGLGTMTLAGINTYTGTTTINAGTLALAGAGDISSSSGVVANSIFDISGLSGAGTSIQSLSGLGGSVVLGAKTLTTGSNDASTTFDGSISGTGGGLTKAGTGAFTLQNTLGGTGFTYTGTTMVNAGFLRAGSLGAFSSGSTFIVAGAAILDLNNFDQSIGALAGTGRVTLGTANLTTGGNNASTAFSGEISGSGGLTKTGTGTFILTEANTYTGGTTISAGTLQLGSGAASTGSVVGDIVDNARLVFAKSGSTTFSGAISGSGSVTIQDAPGGFTFFTGNNTYTGGTTITTGTLSIGNGGTAGSIVGNVLNNSQINFNRSDNLSFDGLISGSGGLGKFGAGMLTLTADNTYLGGTTVGGGELRVNGSVAGAVTVQSGATLSGIGSVGGLVTVQSGGTLSAGQSPGTLTLGALNLNAGSTSVFELGSAGVVGGTSNDLVNVTGNLTLGGTLSVNAPSAGYYRLFNYGTLTSSSFGTINGSSNGTPTVLTNVPNQVNLLIAAAGQRIQFWDGADQTGNGIVNGGTGTWNAANTNWTGAPGQAGINDSWRSSVGVFAGTAGTITVAGTQAFDTLQFSTTGYVLNAGAGGQLQLAGLSGTGTINTDNAVAATIDAPIVNGSSTSLTKVGGGTLILTGANTYSGGTTISGGVLQLGNGGTTGSILGDVVNNGALAFNRSNTYQFNGVISGSGAVQQIGTGTTILTAINSYGGGTTIKAGKLSVSADANLGASTGALTFDGGTLQFTNGAALTLSNTRAITLLGGGGGFEVTSGNVIVTQAIAGSGALTKSGSGFLILSGDNTYGGGTIISAGTLVIGLGGTSGSITGNVLDNGELTFSRSDSLTFGGQISGSGGLAKFGAGTLTLTADNTYTNGTVIAAGTLQLGNGGATGTIASSTLNDGGALVFNRSNLLIFGAQIFGTGSVTQLGTGTTVLTGNNSYSGGTTISGGTLQLGNGGTTGAIVGNVTDNGVFAINRSDALVFGGVISGTGAFQQLGTGTTTLTNTNTYTGPTTVAAGGLTISATGSITSNVTNNATFTNAGTVAGSLTNSGTANSSGTITGGLTNTGTANASGIVNGAIANNAGTFTVTGALAGNSTFINAANATLAIGSSGAYTLQGLLTNSGVVTVASGGQLIATVGGITNNAGGTITVALGGTVKDDLNNAGAITNNGVYLANVASNIGTIDNNKTWTGTVSNAGTFNNNAGATVSGLLTNTAGTTTNNGALNGGANVSGGMFTGAGTVTNLTVSGGIFAPGNGTPGSSMTISGNLAFQSGALYLVALNPAASTFANVAGTAVLNGGAGAAFLAGNYVARQYTILTAAGGVSGTFGSFATLGIPSGFTASLSYDAKDVFLNLEVALAKFSGLNANQQNVANTLTNFFNATGGIPAVFGTLTPRGLTQVSGELATASQQTTFDAMNLFLGLLTDPFVAGRGAGVTAGAPSSQFVEESDASAYAASGKPRSKSERDAYAAVYRKAPLREVYDPRWSVWAAGYGGSQTTDGNAALGSNNTRSSIGGVAVGADYLLSPRTIAGFAVAGGGTSFSVNGSGSGRSDLFQAGAFVRHTNGPAYVTAALAYGWQDVTTDRTVTVAGADLLRAKFNANAFSGRVEGGYRFVTPWMALGVTPYAAGQFTTFDLPGYAEQAIAGANTFALNYAAKDVTASRSELGLRSDKSFAMQNGIFTLRGRAAWAHNFNPDRNIGATFQTLPGASFVVNGAAQASDSALATASAEMKWLNGFSLAATFEGEFSNVTRSYAGKGVVRYSW
jgi:autotransporter-associated beta strand protein